MQKSRDFSRAWCLRAETFAEQLWEMDIHKDITVIKTATQAPVEWRVQLN